MIRKAVKADAEKLASLVMLVLKEMDLAIFDQLPAKIIETIIREAIQTDDYRYSYRHGYVCEREGKIAGAAFGYPDEKEPFIDVPFQERLIKIIPETQSRIFIEKETYAGEWYLDVLVTDIHFRNQGVGTELLMALPAIARANKKSIVGLNCDQSNHKARKLYERMGFQAVGEVMISGHRYYHMQKELISEPNQGSTKEDQKEKEV